VVGLVIDDADGCGMVDDLEEEEREEREREKREERRERGKRRKRREERDEREESGRRKKIVSKKSPNNHTHTGKRIESTARTCPSAA